MKKRSGKVVLMILILIVAAGEHARGQVPGSTESPPGFKQILSSAMEDVGHVVSSPFRMQSKHWICLGAFATLNTIMILGTDAKVDEEFALEDHHAITWPAKKMAGIGDVYNRLGPYRIYLALTGTMVLTGLITKHGELLETARLSLESALITGLITYVAKGFFGRLRPYTGEGPHQFHPLKFSDRHPFRSFPSGHTSHIFAVVTIIAGRHPQWWIKYPAYVLAASVGFQRMNDRQHWASDVLAGAALGYWVGTTLLSRYRNAPSQGRRIHPYFRNGMAGLAFTF
ncbi:MAG: phosphatase PAP2 family protein [Calditrichaeota bacterium]|nr:MAG: phosphatase PAP2 family protein [Calditrichota bacterium]